MSLKSRRKNRAKGDREYGVTGIQWYLETAVVCLVLPFVWVVNVIRFLCGRRVKICRIHGH